MVKQEFMCMLQRKKGAHNLSNENNLEKYQDHLHPRNMMDYSTIILTYIINSIREYHANKQYLDFVQLPKCLSYLEMYVETESSVTEVYPYEYKKTPLIQEILA